MYIPTCGGTAEQTVFRFIYHINLFPELENYLSPFMDAWKSGAQDQLQGQIASAKIPLTRMISPQLYWVMTGNDFSLDINNPNEPKLLCVGNNSDRQNIYSAALGLSSPLKYIVGNSSMITVLFSCPFLLMSFTMRELYNPSAAE